MGPFSERDVVLIAMLAITTVWAISATLVAAHLTGRRSIARWIVDDIRRSLRRRIDPVPSEHDIELFLAEQKRVRSEIPHRNTVDVHALAAAKKADVA